MGRGWAAIDEVDVSRFAGGLGCVPAPAGHEAPLADTRVAWTNANGLPAQTREVCLGSLNVLAHLNRGQRAELLFNSHLDADVGIPGELRGREPAPDELGIPALKDDPPRRRDPDARYADRDLLASELANAARVDAAVTLALFAGGDARRRCKP